MCFRSSNACLYIKEGLIKPVCPAKAVLRGAAASTALVALRQGLLGGRMRQDAAGGKGLEQFGCLA